GRRPPGEDSSSIRVESPGVERTLSSNPRASTEFDLSVNEGNVPPELAEADAAAREGSEWKPPSEPDLFIKPKSAAEINPRHRPSDETAPESSVEASGSSIFSAGKTPVPAGAGGSSELPIASPTEEDISVEFSDHPTAEPEGGDAGLPREAGVDGSNEGPGAPPPGPLASPSARVRRGKRAD